ncbi:hypothetical protein BpHYR1_054690 [Brachionus plicatilis]|uniref:Uncharacterized protein n=1 Tax=Brachionus plicatilis TaxID=10195 RepID=A0A3M7SJE0_BRAPC|nr:hypothetical protein BpHYR1_054690 [Brachionus plicatilis]
MKYLFSLRTRTLLYSFHASRALHLTHLSNISPPAVGRLSPDLINTQCRPVCTTCLKKSQQTPDPLKKPSKEQLLLLKERLASHLPKFLVETHPYNMYTNDVIFENLYQEPGKISTGALQYAIQLTMLRMKVHWKYSNARLEVLKITVDDLDSTVKVRWRIVGIRGMKSMTQPWKIKAWKLKESINNEAEWNDGFSILYVRGDGLIYKHTLQRVMSQKDEEPVLVEKSKKVENLDINQTICTKESGLK